MNTIRLLSLIFILATLLPAQEFIYPEDANYSNRFGIRALGAGSNIVALGNSKVYMAKSIGQSPFEILDHRNASVPYAFAVWDGSGWTLEGPGYVNVKDMVVYGSNVIIAGNFTQIEGQPFNYIAGWDGTKWFSVGGGLNGPVNALATDGTNLYAGGSFSRAGDTLAANVALFDGVQWKGMYDQGEIVQGTSGEVLDIDFGDGGVVVVGTFGTAGGVNASNVAAWNKSGPRWTNFSTGTNNRVRAVTPTNAGTVIGGDFSRAGGNDVNNIALWDGSDWKAMGNGSNGVVSSLSNASGEAIAFGYFDDSPSRKIARFRGGIWEVLGGPDVTIDAISMATDGSNVWVGNQGAKMPGKTTGNLAMWDGSGWNAAGNGIGEWWSNDAVKDMVEWNNELVVSGRFGNAGGDSISGIARWDGQQWHKLGEPFSGLDFAWVDALEKAGGKLYAGGWFSDIAGTGSANIGAWDGQSWSGLADGVGGKVYALGHLGNDLYVGGDIWKTIGGNTQYYFAHWDGTQWQSVSNPPGGIIYAMLSEGQSLYVGGEFTYLNDFTTMNGIAMWDGSQWKDLGGGVTGGSFYTKVNAIARGNDGLYVGGDFTMAGSVSAKNIARWDGSQWHALGRGVDGEVFALYANGDDLYVGGTFATVEGDTVWGLARWDGSRWQRMGNGVHQVKNYSAWPTVYSFLGTESSLWIGGNFSHAGVYYSHSIAEYSDFNLVTALGDEDPAPENFALMQNYPNPFNPSTTIRYYLPRASEVSLKIYNSAGRLIRTLEKRFLSSGTRSVVWDGKNDRGREVSAGIYLYKIQAGEFSQTRKAVLIK